MSKATIYIRNENQEFWDRLGHHKSEFVNEAIELKTKRYDLRVTKDPNLGTVISGEVGTIGLKQTHFKQPKKGKL